MSNHDVLLLVRSRSLSLLDACITFFLMRTLYSLECYQEFGLKVCRQEPCTTEPVRTPQPPPRVLRTARVCLAWS
jgi:hypothetical protein